MRAGLPSLVLIVTATVSAACGSGAFLCADASECENAGVGGVCQADGHCSFPDDDCASGQRYGEHSGAVAGECVPVPDDDGTAADDVASADDTTTSASSTGVDATTLPLDATASTDVDPSAGPTTGVVTDSDPTTDLDTGDTDPPMVDPDLLVWLSFDAGEIGAITNEGVLGGQATCADAQCPEPDVGAVGSALTFDGIDDCLAFASTPELEGMETFTVAAWIRLDGGGEHTAFVDKPVGESFSNSFALYYYTGAPGTVQMYAVTDGTTGAAIGHARGLPMGAWAHVAGTFDGAELGLWIDGQLVGTAMSSLLAFDEQALLVGCDDEHDGQGLSAFAVAGIDDVRVYSRVLSDDEIAEIATP